MKREKLPEAQLEAEMTALARLGGWRLENDELVKEFRFATYLDGVRFAIQVAEEAEKMDHHPDLTISWRRVLLRVTTHSAKGLTELDFELARRSQTIASQGVAEAV